jgi:hypothetical protein
METHHAKTSFRFIKTPSFLDCIFLFPNMKTALKERGFRMLRTLRKTRWLNWKVFLWKFLPTVFRNFLNDPVKVFK